jgi:hypothetical protein
MRGSLLQTKAAAIAIKRRTVCAALDVPREGKRGENLGSEYARLNGGGKDMRASKEGER